TTSRSSRVVLFPAGAQQMTDASSTSNPGPQELTALRQRIADLEAALRTQQAVVQALQATQHEAQHMVETVRAPLLVLTSDFRVQSANPAFYHLFQVSPTETVGQHIYHLGDRQWDIPALHTLLEQILP